MLPVLILTQAQRDAERLTEIAGARKIKTEGWSPRRCKHVMAEIAAKTVADRPTSHAVSRLARDVDQ